MNQLLIYKDPLVLIDTTQNGYGDNTVSHIEHINGLFVQGTSQSQQGATEMLGTDAHAYLDIENPYVQANAFRLEGLYLIANIMGGKENESWYKIRSAKVGQRKLLENDINNVHVFLTKCEALDYYDPDESGS